MSCANLSTAMLPRRLYFRHSTNADASLDRTGLYRQISLALLVVFALALVAAFATEALSLIAPQSGIAVIP